MNLAEIRYYTGQFLDRQDLVSCSRVCHDWHASFTPLIYAHLHTWDDHQWTSPGFERHTSYIRSLYIHNSMSLQQQSWILADPGGCTQLQDLSINLTRMHPTRAITLLHGITNRNPRLRHLRLRFLPAPSNETEFWSLIQTIRPLVTELRLEEHLFSKPIMDQLLELCSEKLEVLHLNKCLLSPPHSKRWKREGLLFPKLREFRIQSDPQSVSWENQLYNFFAPCPNLETLDWDMDLSSVQHPLTRAMDVFATLLQRNTWTRLTSISLVQTSYSLYNFEPAILDLELARLISASPKLTGLALPRSAFGAESWIALGRHLNTLEKLNLTHCLGFTSWMCRQVLMLCPRLRELGAMKLEVLDVVREVRFPVPSLLSLLLQKQMQQPAPPKPWVCSKLESLSVVLVRTMVTKANAQVVRVQEAMMGRQLALLKDLCFLEMNADDGSGVTPRARLYGLTPLSLPGMEREWDFSELTSPTSSRAQMKTHPYGQQLLQLWPRMEYCSLV
ncbi:hypothetical protein EMPS_02685 [Entomortierella parvispora]|uniref:F-box domain-containing protein n=1 Tax=Entomortierella parvispora TaxID=205924 RepID=A0A9P3H585_9FUNG|nr:hypothetical protein EMPS_02685 [Entomortierella parvispora]